jgi:cellulose synthase/poly-beta-1,6-N-acetylglucosamine synthase-like glycosyltransferase
MKVTVLIATRNRSEGLRRTLDSLFSESNLRVPGWEVIVVHDAVAKDGSRAVCQVFQSKYPSHFRSFVQHREGKSNALNLGIAAARGEILALTDDDVICAPDYIASILDVFDTYPADAAQGRIFLDCEGGLPKWMSPALRSFMSWCDYGDEMQIPFTRCLFGTNLVVRTEAARAVGGFSPELGAGSVVGFAEDTEFSLKLRWAGYRIIYAPQVVVRHQLPRRRMTESFFRKRYFLKGRAAAYYSPYPAPLWRFGAHVAKNWVLSDAEALRRLWRGQPTAEAVDCQCEARKQFGFFWQHFLFWCGVPRQLTRVTSWPKRECEESPEVRSPLNPPPGPTSSPVRDWSGRG